MTYFRFIVAVILLASSPCLWAQQNPNGVLPVNNADQPYLFLVRDPVVHKDLNLSAVQMRKLQEVNDMVDASIWTTNNKPPKERFKILTDAMASTRMQLSSILNQEQNERIGQIELRVLGMKSLLRDDVAGKVQLESNQRTEIGQIIKTTQQAVLDLRKQLNDGGDADELNQEFRKTQLNQQQDILALLAPEQRQAWAAILGKRIDVSRLGRIRFKAPELQAGSGWVNSEPLTLEKLKGKVVALHFYAFA